jgi:hypothetical protein
MSTKIDKKIVAYTLLDEGETGDVTPPESANKEEEPAPTAEIIQMHESVARPEMLLGSTYKLKTPGSDHAMYITINDIILNEDTEHEQRRPFEIFINSKNMDHFQWIVALTRITSAVFRKGGDITFLVEEMRAVFDPQGGYFKKGGKFMPSLVAEIGEVIEDHLKKIGMIVDETMPAHQRAILDEKRAQYEAKQSTPKDDKREDGQYPLGASLCKQCLTQAVIVMDGCKTCLSCGDSKCN